MNSALVSVEFSNGKLNLDMNLIRDFEEETGSVLAIIFSISMLHVLLQPKTLAVNPRHRMNPNYATNKYGHNLNSLYLIPASFLLLNVIGFNELVSSDCFINDCQVNENDSNILNEHTGESWFDNSQGDLGGGSCGGGGASCGGAGASCGGAGSSCGGGGCGGGGCGGGGCGGG